MNKSVILWSILYGFLFLFLCMLIPSIIVFHGHSYQNNNATLLEDEHPVLIPVYLTKKQMKVNIPLEWYVRGVVAAEMPIEFPLEALKAQALAARTYAVYNLNGISDTTKHQVFSTLEALKKKWGMRSFTKNIEKLNQAVNATKGLILTYEHQPINATFFSTSNGYTENSEDVWGKYVPYLRSVMSPWDQRVSPKFTSTIDMNAKDVIQKLSLSSIQLASFESFPMKIVQMSKGHRIEKVRIDQQLYTGREIRDKLGLNSTDFSWKIHGPNIEITTYGYGHGVGMSQWGADALALAGKKAETIVKYYYTGIQIEPIRNIVMKK